MMYNILFSVLIAFFSIFSFSTKNKNYPQNFFSWPLKGEIDITGNFGELRTNHFHSGIDLRTSNGQTGIPVYASADGYIGRINISSKGYGKALYVIHQNGYSTVYGHLEDFEKKIKDYSEKIQYEKQLNEIEIFPEKNLLKVKKGELIAYSGNSGGSAGPHLHFEIRNTNTEEVIDPLLFGLKLKDKVKPEIKSLVIYRIDSSQKAITGDYRFIKFDIDKNALNYKTINPGVGIFAIGLAVNDFIKHGGFCIGTNQIKMYINNNLYFEQNIEKFKFSDSRSVNCHLDFALLEEEEIKVAKLFIDNGNLLDFYPTAVKKGKIILKKNEKLKIKIIVSDFANNKDSILFEMQGRVGKKDEIPVEHLYNKINFKNKSVMFYPEKFNTLQYEENGETVKVEVPAGVLFDTVLCNIGNTENKIDGNNVWQIMNSNIAVNNYFTISFKPKKEIKNPEKLVLVRVNKKNQKKPEITFAKEGFICAKVKNTGNYYLTTDTIVPEISEVKINEIKFSAVVNDNISGIKEYIVKIDENWILAYYEPKKNLIEGKIPDFIKCGIHKFSIKVIDYCDNISIYEQTLNLNNCFKSMKLKIGDNAPQFSTKDQNGNTVKLSDLSNSKIVLYFYPKDDTPGCTAEACNLRDNYEMLISKGFKIFGVSPDSAKQHVKFIEKYNLPFDLLTDEDHVIAETYGTWVEKSMYGRNYMGMARVTFIIEKGIITEIIEKVDTKNHANQILK